MPTKNKKKIEIHERGKYELYFDSKDTKKGLTPSRLKLISNKKNKKIIMIPKSFNKGLVTFRVLNKKII